MRTRCLLHVFAAILLGTAAQAQRPEARPANPPLPPTTSATASIPLPPAPERFAPAAPLQPLDRTVRTTPAATAEPQSVRRTAKLPAQVLFDERRPDQLWALGHTWKAVFDAEGCTLAPFFGSEAPRNYPVRLQLRSVRVGDEALTLHPGAPRRDGTQVHTDRGSLVETYATTLDRLEQSFTFASLPNRGAITVELDLASELQIEQHGADLRLCGEHGVVAYEHAVAVDAAGARLPLRIARTPTGARIEIPADFVAKAQLPLVLDPWIQARFDFGQAPTTPTPLQQDADIATLQGPDRVLCVWLRQWSQTDQDCFGEITDLSFGSILAQPDVTLDFSFVNWQCPRVASNQSARNFLVVAQLDLQSPTTWIGGCLVDGNGQVGPTFDIERSGFVGLGGDAYRPDVGGDPFPSTPSYYTVVFEHQNAAGNRDVYYKQVDPAGNLRSVLPSPLATTSRNETWPTISTSLGTADWRIAWQSQWDSAPFDQDLHVAHVSWFGSVTVPPYLVAGSLLDEQRPSVSSFAQPESSSPQVSMLAYELGSTAPRDVVVTIHDTFGTFRNTTLLSLASLGGTIQPADQSTPSVDTDGVRFVVAYEEPAPLGALGWLSTLRWRPSTNQLLLDDDRSGAWGGVRGTRLSGMHGGSLLADRRVMMVTVDPTTQLLTLTTIAAISSGSGYGFAGNLCSQNPQAWVTITGLDQFHPGGTFSVIYNDGAGPALASMFGTRGSLPLIGLLPNCDCTLGVMDPIFAPPTLVISVPNDIGLVGAEFAVQGLTIGPSCMGLFDLQQTVHITIL